MVEPQRGEVWRVRLDPTLGSEQAKTRPVIVLSGLGIGRASMRICVPITNYQNAHAAFFWCVPLNPNLTNGLTKISSADASQVRALDVARFVEAMGVLEVAEVEDIALAVSLCVGFSPLTAGEKMADG